jgi:glycine betaine/proline transport system substrate-binding protein
MKHLVQCNRCLIGLIVLAVALAFGTAKRVICAELPGKGVTVQPVDGGIPGEVFQLEIIVAGLKRLGYKVKPSIVLPLQAGTPHLLVAQGDADFFPAHWDPLHKAFYETVGGGKTVERVGVLIEGCMQGYFIDKKTADKYGIKRLDQLKDPAITPLFDSDGNGKADLTGCHPGWGCYRVIEHQLDAYALRDVVTHHQEADYFAMIEDTISRFQAGEPILYYTWTPLWVSGVLVPGKDVVWLNVPFTALPGERTETNTTLPDGRNPGFAVNKARILANKKFLEANPVARRLFELIKIPINDVSAQNGRMHNGENKPKDILRHAREWIVQNKVKFDSWIEEALKAAQ